MGEPEYIYRFRYTYHKEDCIHTVKAKSKDEAWELYTDWLEQEHIVEDGEFSWLDYSTDPKFYK